MIWSEVASARNMKKLQNAQRQLPKTATEDGLKRNKPVDFKNYRFISAESRTCVSLEPIHFDGSTQ